MKYLAITATHGRHQCLERAVGLFLNNSYEDKTLLIHNNSPVPQKLDRHYSNIILVNYSERAFNQPYKSLGDIYNHTLILMEQMGLHPDVVSHWDDDDMYLTNHIEEGVKGYTRALEEGKLAYKPKYSFYRHHGGIVLMNNTLEPSIFVSYDHLYGYGYSDETTAQHLKWVNPLVYEKKILVDEHGPATLIYNWGPDVPTFKTSGDPNNPHNFSNYRNFSVDNGDRVITPLSPEELQPYYNVSD